MQISIHCERQQRQREDTRKISKRMRRMYARDHLNLVQGNARAHATHD